MFAWWEEMSPNTDCDSSNKWGTGRTKDLKDEGAKMAAIVLVWKLITTDVLTHILKNKKTQKSLTKSNHSSKKEKLGNSASCSSVPEEDLD